MQRNLRSALGGALAVLGLAVVPVALAKETPNWAAASIATVLKAGLLPETTAATFAPERDLDHGTLALLIWGAVPGSMTTTAIPTDVAPATIGEVDRLFVTALGLADTATQAREALAAAGYEPGPDAGTEIVARLLGLRFNHPAGDDGIERAASEAASRAEAAYTTAKLLGGLNADYVRSIVAKFAALPKTTGERHAVIQRAISMLGQPYVWGGTWEKATGGPVGEQLHGGFDCSGLIWRVMAYDAGAVPGVARRIGGRTTYEMARTTRRRQRLRRTVVRPGDILLFGSAGRRSKPANVGHAGIAIGAGLMIHSSSQGVVIKEWDAGWHATSFAWGKSVLPG